MSNYTAPLLAILLTGYALLRGVRMYDVFVQGALEGLHTAFGILPYLLTALVAVELMKVSGAMDILTAVMRRPMQLLGLPAELTPFTVLRPFSGSAALAALQDIYVTQGPDSLAARIASAIMGSTETIFYTLSLYFGAHRIQKSRHTLPAALVSMLAGMIAASLFCRIL
ncbi:MAG: spore maturation protein [Eubacteriales bacterium]|nr:spore maturation protein [Eubacteriales bacterium]